MEHAAPITVSASSADAALSGYIAVRKLLQVWMGALDAGEKFVEFQRYQDRGNMLSKIHPGAMVLLGPIGDKAFSLHAIAIVAEEPIRRLDRSHIPAALKMVPERLHDEFLNVYLVPKYKFFDYVLFSHVLDLRPFAFTVRTFFEKWGLDIPNQNQGFAEVKNASLERAQAILRWCAKNEVVVRSPPGTTATEPRRKRARTDPRHSSTSDNADPPPAPPPPSPPADTTGTAPSNSPATAPASADSSPAPSDDELDKEYFPHLASATLCRVSQALTAFVTDRTNATGLVRCWETGGGGDCLFHSVATCLEALLLHSPAARRHVLEHVPLNIFAEGRRALVRHLRHLCARQLQHMSWTWLIDYCLQGSMRKSIGAWEDSWSPEDLLRRSGLESLLAMDTVRAVGADPAGSATDIIINADSSVAEPGARARQDHNIRLADGEVKLALFLGELQDIFATTGNMHWGDATDARLLSEALNIGIFMFADRLQDQGRCCLCSLNQLRGDFPFFINLWWLEPVHFRAADIRLTPDSQFHKCYSKTDVPDFLQAQYNLANRSAPFGSTQQAM